MAKPFVDSARTIRLNERRTMCSLSPFRSSDTWLSALLQTPLLQDESFYDDQGPPLTATPKSTGWSVIELQRQPPLSVF
jgi:hypothetical protein